MTKKMVKSSTKKFQYIKGKDGYSIGMIDHDKKTVSPIHGYYHPHPESKRLASYAKRLGYKHTDPEINKESKNTNMDNKLIRLTEQDLHRIVKESVNRILKEDKFSQEAYDTYKKLCQIMRDTVPTLKVNDIELRPTYQKGHTFIIFDSTFSEEIVDLKMFAKKFVIENGFNQWFIFDIKGFSDENRLWVEVFSK